MKLRNSISTLLILTLLFYMDSASAGHRARILNEQAINTILEVWPNLRAGLEASVPGVENVGERVVMTTSPPWSHFQTVAKGGAPSAYELGQAFKIHAERNMLPLGITQFESRLDKSSEVSAFHMLLRDDGHLPVRFAWHYEQHRQPIFTDDHVRQFYTDRGVTWTSMENGSPWLWLGGVGSEGDGDTVNGPCMRHFAELSDPRMENCPDLDNATTDALLNGALQAGWRFVGMHAIGPGMVYTVAEHIEKAMKINRDLSLERIRKMRHSFAHGTLLGCDPEMLDIARKYNFILVVDPHRAFHDEPGFVDRYLGGDYGWIAPIKCLLDGGVKTAVEFGGFEGLEVVVTREQTSSWGANSDVEAGIQISPDQAVDRVMALKLVTTWAAYSLFSETHTGSLVPGKYADFIVLDKDYLSGPDEDISENSVLMTVINGEVKYQDAGFMPK